jgi:hypothetical protein
MNGWVIVYLPGGDIYDMLDTHVPQNSLQKRLLKRGIKTFLVVVQLWWWIKT